MLLRALHCILLSSCLVALSAGGPALSNIQNVSPQSIEKQAAILLEFKHELSGAVLTAWEGPNPCSWPGIVCDETGTSVLAIELNGYGLEGSLSPVLGMLSTLRSVDLRHNMLTGSSPAAWAEAPQLTAVALSHNRLTGSLPSQWTRFEAVFLDDNQLTGGVPSSWVALDSNLAMVYLQGNLGLCSGAKRGAVVLLSLHLGARLRVDGACALPLPIHQPNRRDEREMEMQQTMLLEVYRPDDEVMAPGPWPGPQPAPGSWVPEGAPAPGPGATPPAPAPLFPPPQAPPIVITNPPPPSPLPPSPPPPVLPSPAPPVAPSPAPATVPPVIVVTPPPSPSISPSVAPAPAPEQVPPPSPSTAPIIPTVAPSPALSPVPAPSNPAPGPSFPPLSPVPVPLPAPEPAPQPSPVPVPSPVPAPSPVPSPAPAPLPVPAPSPVPSPIPVPTPAPSPTPSPIPAPSPTPAPIGPPPPPPFIPTDVAGWATWVWSVLGSDLSAYTAVTLDTYRAALGATVGIVPGQINLTTSYTAAVNLSIAYGSTDTGVLTTALQTAVAQFLNVPASSVNVSASIAVGTTTTSQTISRRLMQAMSPGSSFTDNAGSEFAEAKVQVAYPSSSAAASGVATLVELNGLVSLLATQLVGAPGFVPARLSVTPLHNGPALSPRTYANASLTQTDLRAGAYGNLRSSATAPAIQSGLVSAGMPDGTLVLLDQLIAFTAASGTPPLSVPPPPAPPKSSAAPPFWAWIILGVGLAVVITLSALCLWWLRRRRRVSKAGGFVTAMKSLEEEDKHAGSDKLEHVIIPVDLPADLPPSPVFERAVTASVPRSSTLSSPLAQGTVLSQAGSQLVPALNLAGIVASNDTLHAVSIIKEDEGAADGGEVIPSTTTTTTVAHSESQLTPQAIGSPRIPRSAIEIATPRDLDLGEESEGELGSAAAPVTEFPLAGMPMVQVLAPCLLRSNTPSAANSLATRLLADQTEHLVNGTAFGPNNRWVIVEGSTVGATTLLRYASDTITGETVTIKFYADTDEYRNEVKLHATLVTLDDLHLNPMLYYKEGGEDFSNSDKAPTAQQQLPPYTVSVAPDFTLRELLDSGRSVQPPQARVLVADAAGALAFLHAAEICHGSLCPSALGFFGHEGRWKLVAAETWARKGEQMALRAELRYASPEQCRTDVTAGAEGSTLSRMRADPAGDVWALGVVAYEVLVGHAFFPPGETSDEDVVKALLGYTPLPSEGAGALAAVVQDVHARRALSHLIRRREDKRWTSARAAHCNFVRIAGDLRSARVLTSAR